MQSTFRQTWRIAAFTFTAGLLTSCAASTPTDQTRSTDPSANPAVRTTNAPKVVATTTILCDLTKRIAGDTVDLTCLLKPGVDGHVYEPVPDDRRAIEDAKLVFYSGYDFEPDLVKLIQSSSNAAVKVAVGEVAVPKPLLGEKHEHDEPGEEPAGEHGQEHAEEHSHSQEQANEGKASEGEQAPDPHVWQNAENGGRMTNIVQENLARLVPEQADLYAKNAQALETELAEIHRWIQSQIATIPTASRKLVTTHDALGYYSAAYSIPVQGALQGISTEEKPTATRVKELVDEVKEAGVSTIFAEVTVNPKLIQTVAKESNVKVSDQELYADSLGEPGSEGDTYPKMLIANTKAIVEGLGGQYTAFQPK